MFSIARVMVTGVNSDLKSTLLARQTFPGHIYLFDQVS